MSKKSDKHWQYQRVKKKENRLRRERHREKRKQRFKLKHDRGEFSRSAWQPPDNTDKVEQAEDVLIQQQPKTFTGFDQEAWKPPHG